MEVLLGIFYGMGALYILFGFLQPPSFLQHFFKVPSIFLFFLPDKYLFSAGRVITGLFLIAVSVYLQFFANFSNYNV